MLANKCLTNPSEVRAIRWLVEVEINPRLVDTTANPFSPYGRLPIGGLCGSHTRIFRDVISANKS